MDTTGSVFAYRFGAGILIRGRGKPAAILEVRYAGSTASSGSQIAGDLRLMSLLIGVRF